MAAICPLAAATGGHAHSSEPAGQCFRGQPDRDMSILQREEWAWRPSVQRLRLGEGMSIGQPGAAASPGT
jgi:hypothetical protein